MKKIIYLIFLLTSGIQFSSAQNEDIFYNYQASVFGNLDKTKILTGILYNAGIVSGEYTQFTGDTIPDTTNWNKFMHVYNNLYTGQLATKNLLTIEHVWNMAEVSKTDEVIPVGILNYNYNSIKSNAIDDKLLIFKDNKLYDSNLSSQESPYDKKRFFMVSPVFNELLSDKLTVTFSVPYELYFSNHTSDPVNIFIDFDDGKGYVSILFNELIDVNYSTYGTKLIKTKVEYQGRILFSNSYLDFKKPISNKSDYGNFSNPDEYITKTGYKLGIWYNDDMSCLDKAAFFIEGFDPLNKQNLYGTKSGEAPDSKDEAKEKRHLFSIFNTEKNILDNLKNKGYDIIIIDFDENNIDMQENAMNVVSAIQYINSIKESDEELITGARSGGGLLIRYALAYMEENSIDHETKLMLTMDSEHKNANVPLGIQHLTDFITNWNIIAAFPPFYHLINYKEEAIDCDYAKQMLRYHYTETNVSEHKAYCSTKHTAFFNALESLNGNGGYPKQTKNISVTNSSIDGDIQALGSSEKLTELTMSSAVQEVYFRAGVLPDNTSGTIFRGYRKIRFPIIPPFIYSNWVTIYSSDINVDNTLPYDHATGSYFPWQRFSAPHFVDGILDVVSTIEGFYFSGENPCFVPIYSSIDLKNDAVSDEYDGLYFSAEDDLVVFDNIVQLNDRTFLNLNTDLTTPFDIISGDLENSKHIKGQDNWIYIFGNQIYHDEAFLQNQYINDKKIFWAEFSIYAGENVSPNIPRGDFILGASSDVTLKAKENFLFEPGFKVEYGAEFSTELITDFSCNKEKFLGKEDMPESIGIDKSDNYISEPFCSEISELIIETENSITVYPNPTADNIIVTFNLKKETPMVLEIYNQYGSLKFKKETKGRSDIINLSSYNSGIYILKVIVNNQNYSRRIIKN